MKLLLDACIWSGARDELTSAGHDVLWAGEWPENPSDEELLRQAHQAGRVLVTLDKDFGEWAILRGLRHCGILRLVGCRARQQATLCRRVLTLHAEELAAGAIVTAEPGRLRIRTAE